MCILTMSYLDLESTSFQVTIQEALPRHPDRSRSNVGEDTIIVVILILWVSADQSDQIFKYIPSQNLLEWPKPNSRKKLDHPPLRLRISLLLWKDVRDPPQLKKCLVHSLRRLFKCSDFRPFTYNVSKPLEYIKLKPIYILLFRSRDDVKTHSKSVAEQEQASDRKGKSKTRSFWSDPTTPFVNKKAVLLKSSARKSSRNAKSAREPAPDEIPIPSEREVHGKSHFFLHPQSSKKSMGKSGADELFMTPSAHLRDYDKENVVGVCLGILADAPHA